MRKHQAGTIVNVSSSVTLEPVPALGIYGATKCALEGMIQPTPSFTIEAIRY